MLRHIKAFFLILSSAALLIFSYPQMEWSPLVWVALVPFLFAIDGKSIFQTFRRSYLLGFLFFFGTLGWFVYVTYPGAILLCVYLALYFVIFGLCFIYFRKLPFLLRIFVLSSVWVALEFIRSHLMTGFGWVTLGHSQYKNLLLIQIADITGVYGISFLVILVNLLIFETLRVARHQDKEVKEILPQAQIIIVLILAVVLGYGYWTAIKVKNYPTVKIGVVQPNIAQAIKWDELRQPEIVARTLRLTKELEGQKPDLIIWPETSLPGIISDVPYLAEQIQHTAQKIKIPILIGAITQEKSHYYNSAFLISDQGQIQARYDKMHLVPFGEYLPLRPVLGWINHFVPLEDFTSGHSYKILSAGCPQKKFGVLICFEDTVSYLRRGFAKAGALFFVNMTNDAWFLDTKAPFLHLQAAVLGCVENKRALVRSANTGVSGFVDPWGRITNLVSDAHNKKTFIQGTSTATLPLVSELTFYTKFGDIFTYLCFLCILVGITFRRFK